jgi:hypothetical protein
MMLDDPTTTIELLEDLGDCEKAVRKEREGWWIRNTPNCVNQRKLQTAEEKRKASAEAAQRYRASHPEKIAAYNKKWREAHPEYLREWRKLKAGASSDTQSRPDC